MKKTKKILSAVIALTMLLSMACQIFAATTNITNTIGVTYEITFSPETLSVSDSAQTVTMEINANKVITYGGIGAKIYCPEGWTIKSITNKEITLKASDYNTELNSDGRGSLGFWPSEGDLGNITNICVVVYEIPANAPAQKYELGVDRFEITDEYGSPWEPNATVTKDFEITPAPPAPSHPAKPEIDVTGTYTYTGSDQTATVTGFDSATMNITGNIGKKAGDYTVSVTSKTGKWADGSTDAVTKVWTIAKATPSYSAPTGLTGTKGKALSTVTLPSGWAWKTPAAVMNTVGNQTFKAIYTPNDTANYNMVDNVDLTVAVSEPPVENPAKPVIDVKGKYTYTGSDQTATVTGFDSATMNITGNIGKNAGDYTVSVTSKTGKWADGSTDAVTKTWSIAKATPTGKPKYTSVTKAGKTLADAALTMTGATFNVDGTVKWIADDGTELSDTTAVTANAYYKWQFTPTDTANYEILTGTVKLYRKSSGGGGGTSSVTRYTVSFETNGGSKITSQSVTKNAAAKEPAEPTKEGFDFAGWFTDKELKTEYDFSEKVTGSVKLYAKWTEKDNSKNQIILTIDKTEAKVFGKTKTNDVAPKIVNSRTMLPARFVAESLGAEVSWDSEKKLVTIVGKNAENEEVTILITIGEENALVNGKKVELDSPAFIENDRTYTPIRFIAETLGAEVLWDSEKKVVTITKSDEDK